LLEHFVYDDNGQLLTGSFADYLLPTASDFPNIHAIALEQKPSPHNPLGAKGAGEGGIIPVGGVVANAVAAALVPLGAEPRELPLSPPRIWQLIADAVARREQRDNVDPLRGPMVEQVRSVEISAPTCDASSLSPQGRGLG
jgi:aerobic carbon-monoxide dehydrogenase large subunit